MYKHILVPVDGSALSLKAVKEAARLARSSRGRITALHVIPPFQPAVYTDGFMYAPELYSAKDYRRITEGEARKMLAKAEKLAKTARVRCDTLYEFAIDPWEAIIKTAHAKKCDLIAMASHGRRGLSALVLGSETTKVLTHSKIPVLVCR